MRRGIILFVLVFPFASIAWNLQMEGSPAHDHREEFPDNINRKYKATFRLKDAPNCGYFGSFCTYDFNAARCNGNTNMEEETKSLCCTERTENCPYRRRDPNICDGPLKPEWFNFEIEGKSKWSTCECMVYYSYCDDRLAEQPDNGEIMEDCCYGRYRRTRVCLEERKKFDELSPGTCPKFNLKHMLFEACPNGDVDGVKMMIDKYDAKTVVNAKNWAEKTCLHSAAFNGRDKLVAFLQENGADLDAKDEKGQTPLRYAVIQNRYSTITLLLQLSADLQKAKEYNEVTNVNINVDKNKFDLYVRNYRETKEAIRKGQLLAGSILSGTDIFLLYPELRLELEWQSTAPEAEIGKWQCLKKNGKWAGCVKPQDEDKYWCSRRDDDAQTYWTIWFKKPVQIVKITFEEEYEGAEFEFFGSIQTYPQSYPNLAEACAKFPFPDWKFLIRGTRADINGKYFANEERNHCYRLRITKFADAGDLGHVATIKNFDFFIKGFDKLLPKWNYRASSSWSNGWTAEKAMKGQNKYWCSARNDNVPIYWQTSFVEVPAKIFGIKFEETYPGAEFQFFASNDVLDCNADKVFIEGTQKQINGIAFENDQFYPCYGLKITKLAKTSYYGLLATIKNFEFFFENFCEGRTCSGRGTCNLVDNGYLCKCNDSFIGKHCEQTEVVCEDPDMEKFFCLNGGTCMQLKTWYNYEADPDNYWLSQIYCHCAKGWKGKRCDARTYPLNRANKMKVNAADRERV